MSGYTCPVKGCDYGDGDQKSLPAVRAHVNATGDSAHNWGEVKEMLADQDAADSSQSEESKEEPEDMPTQDEYEMQHREEDPEDNSDGANAAAGAAAGAAGVGALLDRPMVLAALIVLAVVVLLAWDGSGEPTTTNQEADAEQTHPADPPTSDGQGGGLA